MVREVIRSENLSCRKEGCEPLDGLRLHVFENEILGLLGLYGSGISTFLDILSGKNTAYTGNLFVGEKRRATAKEPADAGIFFIREQSSLVPSLNVAENLFVIRRHKKQGLFTVSEKAMQREADSLLARYGMTCPAQTPVRDLSAGEAAAVELLKAVIGRAKTVCMELAAEKMTESECNLLVSVLHRLNLEGMTLLLCDRSTLLLEQLADRIVIVGEGKTKRILYPEDYRQEQALGVLLGRKVEHRTTSFAGEKNGILFRAEDFVEDKTLLLDATEVYKGAVLTLLDTSGRLEQGVRNAFLRKGRIHISLDVGGKRIHNPTLQEGYAMGAGFVLPDIEYGQIFPSLSFLDNILFHMPKHRTDLMEEKKAREICQEFMIPEEVLALPAGRLDKRLSFLLLCVRWLLISPKVLFILAPGRMLDYASRDIFIHALHTLRSRGSSVVIFTSDSTEAYTLSDCIQFVNNGRTLKRLYPYTDRNKILV